MTLSYFLSQIYQQDPSLKPYEQHILAYLKENLVGKTSFVVDQNFLSTLRTFIASIQEEEKKKQQQQEDKDEKNQEYTGEFVQQEFLQTLPSDIDADAKCIDQNMLQNEQKEKKTDNDIIKKTLQKQESKFQKDVFPKLFYKQKYFFSGFFVGIFFILLFLLYQFFAPKRGLPFVQFYDIIRKFDTGFVFVYQSFFQHGNMNGKQIATKDSEGIGFSGFFSNTHDDTYSIKCQKNFSTCHDQKSFFCFGLVDKDFFYENFKNTGSFLIKTGIKTGETKSTCDFRFSGKVFNIPQTGIIIDISNQTPSCFLIPLETSARKILSFAQKLALCPVNIFSGKQQYFFSTPIFIYKKYDFGTASYLFPTIRFSIFDHSGTLLQQSIDVYLPKNFYGTGYK